VENALVIVSLPEVYPFPKSHLNVVPDADEVPVAENRTMSSGQPFLVLALKSMPVHCALTLKLKQKKTENKNTDIPALMYNLRNTTLIILSKIIIISLQEALTLIFKDLFLSAP
jgi:hypothetical protein